MIGLAFGCLKSLAGAFHFDVLMQVDVVLAGVKQI
jgi:hypothetical protein